MPPTTCWEEQKLVNSTDNQYLPITSLNKELYILIFFLFFWLTARGLTLYLLIRFNI